jgi:hypothetical protein
MNIHETKHRQPDELEAFCLSCPTPEEVTALLAQLGIRLVFQMEANLSPVYSELARLPAQFHYEHASGMSLIYLAGEDSASEDGVRLPAHQSRFWAYPGADLGVFGWITRRVARQWSFTWQRASSSQAQARADVAQA